jgi:hypothetical protein
MTARLLLVVLIALAFVGSVAVVNAIGGAEGTYLVSLGSSHSGTAGRLTDGRSLFAAGR